MKKCFGTELGLGLIEMVIAAGLGVLVVAGVTVGVNSTSRAGRKVESSVDLVAIKSQLVSSVDCGRTMAGRTPGNACPTPTYIPLKNALNSNVVGAGGQKFGDWTILAQCSSAGIDVRAAKLIGGAANFSNTTAANFKPDEMNRNLSYSFDVSMTTGHPKSQLFRPDLANPSTGLCGAWFGGAAGDNKIECGPNEVMKGVNLTMGTPICYPIPSCGAETALKWDGVSFSCVPARSDTYITNNIVNPPITNLLNKQFDCVTATRTGAGSMSGGGTAVSSVSVGSKGWGMVCNAPYNRTGCSISNSTSGGDPDTDWDVRTVSGGCYTDDEEKKSDAELTIICCKL